MNKLAITILLIAIGSVASPSCAAEASFKHWRNAMKAAEDARYKREFEKMREILEAEVAEAQKLGPASSAENTFWLAFAYEELGKQDLALQAYDAEIDRIGANPTALKLQILRGILLGHRATVYGRLNQLDKALASANEGKTVLEQAAGKFHPELYDINMTIGRIHFFRKEFAEAETSLKAALKLAQSGRSGSAGVGDSTSMGMVVFVTRPAPYRIIRAATDLGELYLLEKKYDSIMQALPLGSLAEVELKRGERKQFVRDTDEIMRIFSKTRGIGIADVSPVWLRMEADLADGSARATADTVKRIASIYEFQNYDFEELPKGALKLAMVKGEADWKRGELLQEALSSIAEGYRATEPVKAGIIYTEIANFNSAHGRAEVADAMFQKAITSQQNVKDKALLIGVLGKIAEAKMAAGNKAEALKYYHQVSVAMREKYGDDMRVADAMDAEAAIMKEVGQEQAAKDLQADAMKLRNKIVLK
jgi:tetratricopeptide (TPR) repeat protein